MELVLVIGICGWYIATALVYKTMLKRDLAKYEKLLNAQESHETEVRV